MTPADLANTSLTLLLGMVTLCYSLVCVIWPFKDCRTCRGTGRLRSPFLRSYRLCPACEATGLRLRTGRKAVNALRRVHRRNRGH
ncbi:hypothetical protein A8924_7386 [Saccharopolyspora erythraea NRRL 2338]|uniref:Uncharacterized protein n=2 Tax=Saccharopolyspora erythraea TaxID=1836 RepID=A4FQ60_SACEN|nr:hypothetical protein [Saccharopolyspora erythraea]EQD84385.1 hypothetical protein N599_20245 [Saccharopolyspora erythraea D]PFG99831.1 hypothetical protein A8924_7386 [Saccharopolyspora erythraea NRRL 2338]QRK89702.1 hypothetical protein JQX30_35165 [Saccharopolyspora erythraea]CAM06185.1 hypothetical protein SACE_7024 [Saccharopolyspora erythraea NRRL 2338]